MGQKKKGKKFSETKEKFDEDLKQKGTIDQKNTNDHLFLDSSKKCASCQKPAGAKSCGSCNAVYYCSVEHQKQHWKIHKLDCPPYVVQKNDEIGQHWIASRNLSPGTILIDEDPAFFGPRWMANDFNSIPNCLTCGVYMCTADLMRKRCDLCHWPVCSQECSRMAIHSKNECRIFRKRQIPFPPPPPICSTPPSIFCDCITLIRGMGLKTENQNLFKEVMGLQQHYFVPECNAKLQKLVQLSMDKLADLIGPMNPDELEEYKALAGLRKVNAFSGTLKEDQNFENSTTPLSTGGKDCASHVFVKGCLLNHSCIPNCAWSIQNFPPKMRIRTIVPVLKGEELTHAYNYAAAELGTMRRQICIRDGFGFICKCARCMDPSELDTFTSAIACLFCNGRSTNQKKNRKEVDHNGGYFLPENPIDLTPSAFFKCNRCEATMTAQELNRLAPVNELATQLRLHTESIRCTSPTDIFDGKEARKFYENFTQLYGPPYNDGGQGAGFSLHENHWLLQLATIQILSCHMILDDSTSRNDLEKFINYYEYLLKIQDKVAPGQSAQRALTLRNLCTVILTLLAEYSTTMKSKEVQHWSVFCRKIQHEALDYYKKDLRPGQVSVFVTKLQQEIDLLDKNLPASP